MKGPLNILCSKTLPRANLEQKRNSFLSFLYYETAVLQARFPSCYESDVLVTFSITLNFYSPPHIKTFPQETLSKFLTIDLIKKTLGKPQCS